MGCPTTFVRTAGCNLRCAWCDTRYAYEKGEEVSVAEVLKRVNALGHSHVCVTGGEPLLQEDTPELVEALLADGRHVTVETNGSLPLDGLPQHPWLLISMDVKCPGSGESEKVMWDNLASLGKKDQLKFVVGSEEDYGFAKKALAERDIPCPVILTPVGGVDIKWLAERVVGDRLAARVLPQLHKSIWGDARGV